MIDTKEPLIIVHVMKNYEHKRGGIYNVVHNLLSYSAPNIRQYVMTNKSSVAASEPYVLHTQAQLNAIKPQIIHLHGMTGFSGKILRYLNKQKTSACLVHSPHGHWHPYVQNERRFYKRWLANILYERILFKRCSRYFVLTQQEIKNLKEKGAVGQFEIVLNGVDQDLLEFSKETYSKSLKRFPKKENTLLFIGEVSPRKGVFKLVSTFQQKAPKDWRLDIYGPTPSHYENHLEAIKKLIGNDARIRLLPPIHGQEKYEAMLNAKLFCLPSVAEGLALGPLEAATMGCKLLVSHACGYEGMEKGEVFYTYDQNSKEALEKLLISMLNKPESFFEPDLDTIESLQSTLEWKTIIENYFALYESSVS